jgi:hypothetical protein
MPAQAEKTTGTPNSKTNDAGKRKKNQSHYKYKIITYTSCDGINNSV